MELAKNIEELVFCSGDNDRLHISKQELIKQMNRFHISITAKGLFELTRQFLATVSTATLIRPKKA